METPSSSPQKERPRPPASALAKERDKERETGSAVLCRKAKPSSCERSRNTAKRCGERRVQESGAFLQISARFMQDAGYTSTACWSGCAAGLNLDASWSFFGKPASHFSQVAGAPFGPVPTLHFSSGTATCSARGTSRILITEPWV